MPKNGTLNSQIQARITEFVEEINGLVRAAAVEAVRDVLGGEVSSGRPARATTARKTAKKAAKKKAAKKGKRVRRSSEEVEALAQAVQSHVSANPGQRLGEIATALGVPTKDARRPAFSLVEEGVLRTEGQRGGTRYFPKGGGGRKAAPKKRAAKKKAGKRKASRKKVSSRKAKAA